MFVSVCVLEYIYIYKDTCTKSTEYKLSRFKRRRFRYRAVIIELNWKVVCARRTAKNEKKKKKKK